MTHEIMTDTGTLVRAQRVHDQWLVTLNTPNSLMPNFELELGRIVFIGTHRAFQFNRTAMVFESALRPNVLHAVADLVEQVSP